MAKKKPRKESLEAQLARLGYKRDAQGRKIKRGSEVKDEWDSVRRSIKRQLTRKRPAAPGASPQQQPGPAVSPEREIRYRRDLPREAPRPRAVRPRTDPVALEDALEDVSVLETAVGTELLIRIPADEVHEVDSVSDRFRDHLGEPGSALWSQLANTCDPADVAPEDVIFMDVESTGLGNSPLFLIGVMVWQRGSFEVQQYFARNYAEEAAVVSTFIDECRGRKLLVTFNGKSFDYPYIRTRAAATGLRFDIDPYHMDMLHVCRRLWKDRLPNCKLQTLESFICKRGRVDDIPGAEIPEAYHDFVRTADGWQMLKVLKHNVLDLITMADLMTRFPAGEGGA